MDKPFASEPLHRLQVMEQQQRRWQMIGISVLVVLALLLICGGGFVGLAYWSCIR